MLNWGGPMMTEIKITTAATFGTGTAGPS